MDQQTAQNLTELEQAEKDLRFYTALIGRRPTMQMSSPSPDCHDGPIPETIKLYPVSQIDPFPQAPVKPNAMRLWMRDLSHLAKKRLDEACHRIAS